MRLLQSLSCLLLFLITACAAVPKAPLVFAPGSAIDTLSASVSLSIHSRTGNMSGNGLMTYHRPDQFHFVMLSPFGSTVLEVFALGEQLTLVYPSQSVAFTGHFDELPEGSGMQGWRLLRWVMDAQPSALPAQSGTIERMSSAVGQETVTFDSGLVSAKSTPAGDRVDFRTYELVNGVPFALELEMQTRYHDRIRLVFDEPEINTTLDGAAFVPRLDGLRLLPLSAIPLTAAPGVAKE
ncbi:MAG: outer membrane lipoprotein LolB [Desulfuromonadales bacterium]|nr:outer membrane lipoprotein LolB [Desulfuromonadales bacterium]